MKAESNMRPDRLVMNQLPKQMVEILFSDNVTENRDGETLRYEYDLYTLWLSDREGLREEIEENYLGYLDFAKETELHELAESIRLKRNQLLAECDWTQVADAPLIAIDKEQWQRYRQELRDVPEQDGFPYDVVWPPAPQK